MVNKHERRIDFVVNCYRLDDNKADVYIGHRYRGLQRWVQDYLGIPAYSHDGCGAKYRIPTRLLLDENFLENADSIPGLDF